MPPFLLLTLLIQSLAPATIFPSDSRAFVQAEDKNIIQTVCPGHMERGGKVECGKNCPSSSGLDMGQHIFDWTLTRVARGHFLSASSDDAVVSSSGCESHSANFGGSILLTRRAEKWRMIWYKPGVETSLCHRVPLKSGREILVCMGTYGGQGNMWTQLYMEDLLHTQGSLMATESHVFEVFNSAPCGENFGNGSKPDDLKRAMIEEVDFAANTSGGPPPLVVEFSIGRRPMTPEAAKACNADSINQPRRSSFTVAMQHYRMEFVFDGHDYKPTPSSAALAKRLGLQ